LATLRLAQTCDLDAVTACARQAYQGYVALIGREPAPMQADYAALIDAGHVHIALDRDGALAGFVVFYPSGDAMMLDAVAVTDAARGTGLGRALVALCEAEAARLGLASVRLYTNAQMASNLTLYPHLGYQEVARKVEDGYRRVYFEKSLRGGPTR